MDFSTNQAKNLVDQGSLWFPEAANQYARNVDFLHDVIVYVSIFLFVTMVGTTLWFVIRFRRKQDNLVAKKQIDENLKIELAWTIIPFIAVMVMFAWGFRDYMQGQTSPANVMEIKVIGQKWNWLFEYPEGFNKPRDLVVPVGKDVRLVMVSRDVLHSFYLPNFRIKRDVIPYRYTSLILRTEEIGSYQVFCTEYCGDQHSSMYATLHVVSEQDYKKFIEEEKEKVSIPPVELGQQIYTSYGCNACHSLDGSSMTGPTWKGLFGKTRVLTDNSEVVADENYLRTSIVSPSSEVVKGYGNVMPSFAYLSDKQIEGVIAYIKTLE